MTFEERLAEDAAQDLEDRANTVRSSEKAREYRAQSIVIRELIAERNVLKARIRDGWTVRRTSLYDEDGVAGWCWDGPSGEEVYQIAWDGDLPSIPDEWGKS